MPDVETSRRDAAKKAADEIEQANRKKFAEDLASYEFNKNRFRIVSSDDPIPDSSGPAATISSSLLTMGLTDGVKTIYDKNIPAEKDKGVAVVVHHNNMRIVEPVLFADDPVKFNEQWTRVFALARLLRESALTFSYDNEHMTPDRINLREVAAIVQLAYENHIDLTLSPKIYEAMALEKNKKIATDIKNFLPKLKENVIPEVMQKNLQTVCERYTDQLTTEMDKVDKAAKALEAVLPPATSSLSGNELKKAIKEKSNALKQAIAGVDIEQLHKAMQYGKLNYDDHPAIYTNYLKVLDDANKKMQNLETARMGWASNPAAKTALEGAKVDLSTFGSEKLLADVQQLYYNARMNAGLPQQAAARADDLAIKIAKAEKLSAELPTPPSATPLTPDQLNAKLKELQTMINQIDEVRKDIKKDFDHTTSDPSLSDPQKRDVVAIYNNKMDVIDKLDDVQSKLLSIQLSTISVPLELSRDDIGATVEKLRTMIPSMAALKTDINNSNISLASSAAPVPPPVSP